MADAESKSDIIESTKPPQLKQFQWQNVHAYDHTHINNKDSCWTFSRLACINRLMQWRQTGIDVPQTSTDIIITRDIALPTDTELVKWISLYLYEEGITNCMREQCLGCALNKRDIRLHIQGGCSTFWPMAVDLYFTYVKAQIVCRLQIIHMFETIKNSFEVNIALPDPDWKGIDESISLVEHTLKELNAEYIIPGDFMYLIECAVRKSNDHSDEMVLNTPQLATEIWV